ncbi:hypothetical protein CWC05_02630 [Pseudoalteromonas ruthenica]|uniref:Uncharacterized protein n=1 Tax=Pseudoalteromonas ruthenica TaxID=151081 RepID=A0A5S3Z7X7_9GAMM|nr:hypothetical protein [Pseudoalteromonas ruthenica]TMP88349.1 hypothetical protein CWC05_02630 [Pseudoalteromonas ruthenica]
MEVNYVKLYFTITLSLGTVLGVYEGFKALNSSPPPRPLTKQQPVVINPAPSVDTEKLVQKVLQQAQAQSVDVFKQAHKTASETVFEMQQSYAQSVHKQIKENMDKQNAERMRRLNGQKKNWETCRFWKAEYKEAKSAYNRAMMDGACERAMNPN